MTQTTRTQTTVTEGFEEFRRTATVEHADWATVLVIVDESRFDGGDWEPAGGDGRSYRCGELAVIDAQRWSREDSVAFALRRHRENRGRMLTWRFRSA